MKAFWRSPVFVLFAATAIILIANGSRQSFGLFVVPISTDLGWGRSEFAWAIAISSSSRADKNRTSLVTVPSVTTR